MHNETPVHLIEQMIEPPFYNRSGPPTLIYRIQFTDDGATVHMRGRLTFGERAIFRDLLIESSEIDWMILDMRDLAFLDSSGLGMLLVANDQLSRKNTKMSIKGASGQVGHILRAAQIEKIIAVDWPQTQEVTNDS